MTDIKDMLKKYEEGASVANKIMQDITAHVDHEVAVVRSNQEAVQSCIEGLN